MTKRINFNQQETAFARETQSQLAALDKALKSLRDQTAGLNRTLRVPVPKLGNRYSKTVRSNPSIFLKAGEAALGGFVASNFISDIGLSSSGSFYSSSSQWASQMLDLSQQAQRNR
jgi:hypothetical protein